MLILGDHFEDGCLKGFIVLTSGLIGFLDPENRGIYAKIRSL